jgi:hypothetical protein
MPSGNSIENVFRPARGCITLLITRRDRSRHTVRLDATDLPTVKPLQWSILESAKGNPRRFAYNRSVGMLHRFLLGRPPTPLHKVVFANGDTLDCRRVNLRYATPFEVVHAASPRLKHPQSGHPLVTWDKRRLKWRVRAWKGRREVFVGYFDSVDEAVAAQRKAGRSVPHSGQRSGVSRRS